MDTKRDILIHRHLTEQIIGAAMEVHNTLGSGFLEKVYENALASELRKRGLKVEQQRAVIVYYKGDIVGEYQADLLVADLVLIELKGVERLSDAHYAQLRNYLKATRIQVGLLINFGAPRLEWKRMVSSNQDALQSHPRTSVPSASSAAKELRQTFGKHRADRKTGPTPDS